MLKILSLTSSWRRKPHPGQLSTGPVALVMCWEQATQSHGVRTQMCRVFFLQLRYSHAVTLYPQESFCHLSWVAYHWIAKDLETAG